MKNRLKDTSYCSHTSSLVHRFVLVNFKMNKSLSTPLSVPLVGQLYNLICPVCASLHRFKCDSANSKYTTCEACTSVIDLRDLSVVSEDVETNNGDPTPVQYSNEVELVRGCIGIGAADQVCAVMQDAAMGMEMPSYLSFESGEAITDEKQALRQKKPMLHFVTLAIERLVFGEKPFCVVGHVKVFRKKLPLMKKCIYIPVPRTSSSYSFLATLVAFFSLMSFYAVIKCESDWFARFLFLLFLSLLCYRNLFSLVYGDPGFLLPGYISGDENAGFHVLDRRRAYHYTAPTNLLKSIEEGKRASRWENVNGVEMERKWCSQCQFYRPPRAAHCYQCGLCVAVHDHHCGVTGGCVGSVNVRAFLWFTFEGQFASFIGGYSTLRCLLKYPASFSSFTYYFLLFGVVLFSWVVAGFTFGLAARVFYSFVKEITTREFIQGAFRMKRNPYNRGCVRNLYTNLWARQRQTNSLFSEEIMLLWADALDSKKENPNGNV